jgi:hypothetical protein
VGSGYRSSSSLPWMVGHRALMLSSELPVPCQAERKQADMLLLLLSPSAVGSSFKVRVVMRIGGVGKVVIGHPTALRRSRGRPCSHRFHAGALVITHTVRLEKRVGGTRTWVVMVVDGWAGRRLVGSGCDEPGWTGLTFVTRGTTDCRCCVSLLSPFCGCPCIHIFLA